MPPRGVWGHENTIFVVDKDDSYVYAYAKNGGARKTGREFDLHPSNDNAWGIWGLGVEGVAYVIDTDDNMVYRYSLFSGDTTQVKELRLPLGNDNAAGMWGDGEVIWVADMTDDRIYAMYFSGLRISGRDIGITDVSSPTGLWTDGETMWVADAGPSDAGKLFAYDVSSGSRDTSKDVRLATSNDNPVAVWSDGTTVWVAENESSAIFEFLYAYALDQDPNEQQLLQSDQSILLDPDNSSPVGAWSDGDTIWVSDSGTTSSTHTTLPTNSGRARRIYPLSTRMLIPLGFGATGRRSGSWIRWTNTSTPIVEGRGPASLAKSFAQRRSTTT